MTRRTHESTLALAPQRNVQCLSQCVVTNNLETPTPRKQWNDWRPHAWRACLLLPLQVESHCLLLSVSDSQSGKGSHSQKNGAKKWLSFWWASDDETWTNDSSTSLSASKGTIISACVSLVLIALTSFFALCKGAFGHLPCAPFSRRERRITAEKWDYSSQKSIQPFARHQRLPRDPIPSFLALSWDFSHFDLLGTPLAVFFAVNPHQQPPSLSPWPVLLVCFTFVAKHAKFGHDNKWIFRSCVFCGALFETWSRMRSLTALLANFIPQSL